MCKLRRIWLNDIPDLYWEVDDDTIEFFEAKTWRHTEYYCCIPDGRSLNSIISTIQSELQTTKRVWIVLSLHRHFNVKLGFKSFKNQVRKHDLEEAIDVESIAEYGQPIWSYEDYGYAY